MFPLYEFKILDYLYFYFYHTFFSKYAQKHLLGINRFSCSVYKRFTICCCFVAYEHDLNRLDYLEVEEVLLPVLAGQLFVILIFFGLWKILIR